MYYEYRWERRCVSCESFSHFDSHFPLTYLTLAQADDAESALDRGHGDDAACDDASDSAALKAEAGVVARELWPAGYTKPRLGICFEALEKVSPQEARRS